MTRIIRRIRALAVPLALAFTLASCVVYDPAPAYPSYGYAYSPDYYYAPAPSFYFGYGGYRHHRHHWRG